MGTQKIWTDAGECKSIEELATLLATRLDEFDAACETSQEYERLPHWGELTPAVGDLIGSNGELDLVSWDTTDTLAPGWHKYLMIDWTGREVYILTEGDRRARLQPPTSIVETDLAEITREQLEELTYGLGHADWAEYAERLEELNPVLGAYEMLHAEACDANSPNVSNMPRHVLDDVYYLLRECIDTPEAARAKWMEQYGHVD